MKKEDGSRREKTEAEERRRKQKKEDGSRRKKTEAEDGSKTQRKILKILVYSSLISLGRKTSLHRHAQARIYCCPTALMFQAGR